MNLKSSKFYQLRVVWAMYFQMPSEILVKLENPRYLDDYFGTSTCKPARMKGRQLITQGEHFAPGEEGM